MSSSTRVECVSASRATRFVQVTLVKSIVDDLPTEVWDIRLDVALPMFLLFWAMVLGRGVPSLMHKSFEEVRAPDGCCARLALMPFSLCASLRCS